MSKPELEISNESGAPADAGESRHSREEFLARGLMLRVVQGDERALRELYELWASTLLGIAVRLTGDHREAEEAVQDVFVRIWQRAATYDPAAARPFVWAYAILRGICLDRLRKNGRQKRGRGVAFEAVTGLEVDDTRRSELICREVTEQVLRGMAALPDTERRCLELYIFQEFTQQEIATAIRSPLGTVKTRVRRSLQRLREIIETHV